MLSEILLKVIVGIVVGVTVGGASVAVYKVLTKDKIKKDVEEQIKGKKSEEQYKEIFDIRIKEKVKKGEQFSVDDIDKWAEEDTVIVDIRDKNQNTVVSNIIVTGDGFDDDVKVGTVIKLFE